MTRTDVIASSRPQTATAESVRRGSPRALRPLLALPIALLLAVAVVAPTTAFAAETGSGYNQKPPTPTTPTTTKTSTTPEPKSGTSPVKEEVPPAKTSTVPTTESAKTLPFTGFDLRWTVGIGLLLIGAGFSIVTVQRRQRRNSGS